jgi:hypothetical protein
MESDVNVQPTMTLEKMVSAPRVLPAPEVTGGSGPRLAPKSPQAPAPAQGRPAPTQPQADRGPVLPNLSAADRAAIANATGYYISANGEVTPEGMTPWTFIVQFAERRRAERGELAARPVVGQVEGAGPVNAGRQVDVAA